MARRRQLVERREELGFTQKKVAKHAGCDVGTYRAYEAGRSTPRPGDRLALAEALEWTTAQLHYALNDAMAPPNGHAVPDWLGHLASLEQAAAAIWAWEPVVIHGLCQTPGYAAAVERVGPGPHSDNEVARRVELRVARQAVLDRRPDPLELSVILDESVLHRVAGGPDVMAGQLGHLASLAGLPNVDVRVLPLDAGVFSAAFGAFKLIASRGADGPFMACVEDRAGPHYLDRPPELDAHRALFEFLADRALSPAESVDRVRLAKETYR